MTEFTPFSSLIGGALIGCAAILLMATSGRIAGISGIVSALLPPTTGNEYLPRLVFVFGLMSAPILYTAVSGQPVAHSVSSDVLTMGAAGLLVGFGSVFGGGCTSGHGVCGLARLSVRSLAATITFMGVAIVTVYVTRHLIGN